MARTAQLHLALRTALIVAIPLTQACTSEDGAEVEAEQPLGALGTAYLDYVGLVDDVDGFYCECSTQAGDFESVQECVAFIGGPMLPPMLAECYAQTLDAFDEVRGHLDCQTSKYETLFECLSTAGCGGDFTACEAQAYEQTCPARGYEADAALAEACLGYSLPPAFECGDGTKIMPWFECDFLADCPDGTDEYIECPGAFACEGGQVISQEWLCDGLADCAGGDDEANCPP